MKVLGIDYGAVRVGVALSDDSGRLAFPHVTLPNNAILIDALKTLIVQHEVRAIVVGRSIDQHGKENPIMQSIQSFVASLQQHIDIPVHFENEQFTSHEARRFQGRTEDIDASAAALILQRFLDKQN